MTPPREGGDMNKDRLAAALGASHHSPVRTKVTGNPLDLLTLAIEVEWLRRGVIWKPASPITWGSGR